MQRTGQKEPLLQQAASSSGPTLALRVWLLRTALGSLHMPWLRSSMVDLQPNPRKSVGIKKHAVSSVSIMVLTMTIFFT